MTGLTNLNRLNGRLSSRLAWADPRRGWDFINTGHGDAPWEDAAAFDAAFSVNKENMDD